MRQSKRNILSLYNNLFKRVEEVPLNVKWDTDDEDDAADVASSSTSEADYTNPPAILDSERTERPHQNLTQVISPKRKHSALTTGRKV